LVSEQGNPKEGGERPMGRGVGKGREDLKNVLGTKKGTGGLLYCMASANQPH